MNDLNDLFYRFGGLIIEFNNLRHKDNTVTCVTCGLNIFVCVMFAIYTFCTLQCSARCIVCISEQSADH